MKLYAVRKRRGQWTVCSDETVVLNFESYDEALGTAQTAAQVLSNRSDGPGPVGAEIGTRTGGRAWRLPRGWQSGAR
jgi:hypothetical protein